MSSVAGGELVPLDRSLIDCSQSSDESMEPLKLCVRLRFVLMSTSFNCLRFTDGGNSGDGDDDDDVVDVDDETDDSDDDDVDTVNFRLHLDWPVSRNPLANGLLSIFNLVMRSFCKRRQKRTMNGFVWCAWEKCSTVR